MSDQERPTEVQPPAPVSGPKRLLRSRNDRVIAGVAGGLGEYFSVDPIIVRIAFAISVLIGGLGVLAYVALALFVPTASSGDGAVHPAPAERSRAVAIGAGIAIVVVALSWGVFDGPFWGGHGFFIGPGLLIVALVLGAIAIAFTRRRDTPTRDRSRSAWATAAIAVGAFIGLSTVALAAAWAAATGHGAVVAISIIAIGVLLAAAALSGGARWLIAPALALAIPLGAVSAADITFGDSIGERHYKPLTEAAIPTEGYELGVGELVVDLRDLDWQDDTVIDVDLDLGVGDLVVAVPSDVCVTTDFHTRAGNSVVAGDNSDGFDVHSNVNSGATATPRVNLSGELDFGEFRVMNDDEVNVSRNIHGDRPDRGQMAADLTAACSRESVPETDAQAEEPTAPDAPAEPEKPEDGKRG